MTLTPNLRKGLGMAVLILFATIELVFLAVLIGSFTFDESATTEGTVSFLFTMGIFFFPIWWGYRLWKSGKSLPSSPVHSSSEMSDIGHVRIQTKLELAEYRRIVFYLTYTTPVFVFINFLAVAFLIFYLTNGTGEWFALFLLIFTAYLPLGIFRHASKNYRLTKTLHETVTYEFNRDTITATGASFHTTMQWKSLYRVKELKNWFLLHTSQQVAMIIPKKAFTSAKDLDNFRAMTNGILPSMNT